MIVSNQAEKVISMNILQKTGLICILFILISAKPVEKTYLYILTQQENKGDRNAALGIANALQTLNPNFERNEFENTNKDVFFKAIKQNLTNQPQNKAIIIAVGDYTVPTLKSLKAQNNILVIHASHQWTEKHKDLNDVADFVALPTHTVTPKITKALSSTQIIPTIGVAHNLTVEDLRKEYEAHKNELPKANRYLGVILGGDAPAPDGTMHYYTRDEAQQLADYVAGQVKWKKVHLLILNGPRTGKFDPKTKHELKNSHRDGKVDPVTAAFVAELQKRKLVKGKDFTLLDFQFGQPSLQKAVLGALIATHSPLYVAGESTSSISEAVTTLPGAVTVFCNNAMNTTHDAHVTSEKDAGNINVLNYRKGKWILSKASPQQSSAPTPSAAKSIADVVYKQFEQMPGTSQ
jgi:hypothetical protein